MTVILIFTSSLLGAWLTYFLSHHAKFTPVRASSLLTLLFYCVLYLLGVAPDMWAAAFFGGSFGISIIQSITRSSCSFVVQGYEP